MREATVDLQTWTFHCQRCQSSWQDTFEAHHHEGFGGAAIAWRHHGLTSMPPWVHASCPTCPGISLKAMPLVNA